MPSASSTTSRSELSVRKRRGGGQVAHDQLRRIADEALLLLEAGVELRGEMHQKELFGRIVVDQRRGDHRGVTAVRADGEVELPRQQIILEFGLAANVDECKDLRPHWGAAVWAGQLNKLRRSYGHGRIGSFPNTARRSSRRGNKRS